MNFTGDPVKYIISPRRDDDSSLLSSLIKYKLFIFRTFCPEMICTGISTNCSSYGGSITLYVSPADLVMWIVSNVGL